MIGALFTISGVEFRDHLQGRAEFHRQTAAEIVNRKVYLPSDHTVVAHKQLDAEFSFLARHVELGDDYRLTRDQLHGLEFFAEGAQ